MYSNKNIAEDKQFLLNWINETDNHIFFTRIKGFISELKNINSVQEDIPE